MKEKNFFKKGLAIGTAVLFGGASSMGASTSSEKEALLGDSHTISVTDPDLMKKKSDPKTFVIGMEHSKEKEAEKAKLSEAVSLNLVKFYKTGTTEFMDGDAEQEALDSLRNFLGSADFNISKIKIVGKYSKERPYEKNDELAESRMQKGIELVKRVLAEKYSLEEVEKIMANAEALAMGQSIYELGIPKEEVDNLSKEDREALINSTQGTEISLQSIKNIEPVSETVNTYESKENYDHVFMVVKDKSNSMKGEMVLVDKIIESINADREGAIQVVNLGGGNEEAHLHTLLQVLSDREVVKGAQNEILVLTDEPDNKLLSFSDYSDTLNKVLELAKKKNIKIKIKIFNPNQKIGGAKIVSLDEVPQALFLQESSGKPGTFNTVWENRLNKWYASISSDTDEGSISSK